MKGIQVKLKKLHSTAGKAGCFLVIAAVALSLMGSTVTLCGPGCYAADLSHMSSHASPHHRPSWSADGTRIAFSHLGVIYVVTADGSSLKPVVKPDPDLEWFSSPFSPAISPDGSQVAYVQNSDSCKANFDIFVSDIDGSYRRRLTDHAATDTNPVWSPDGSRIAFMSDRESEGHDFGFGSYAYFTVKADGSDLRKVSGSADLKERDPPVWSPDSERLAFVAEEWEEKSVSWRDIYRARNSPDPQVDVREVSREVIYAVEADGSNMGKLWDGTVRPGFTPRSRAEASHLAFPEEWIEGLIWSPDGRRVAFAATVYGESPKLYVMDLDSSEVRRVPSPREYGEHWLTPMTWPSGGSDLLFWFGANWWVDNDWRLHSGIYAANADSPSSVFLGEFPLPQMSNTRPFYPSYRGGEIGVHPSGVVVYFTQDLNIHSDTLLYTIDLDGSNMQVLVRRDGTELRAGLLVEDDYLASCSESLVSNPEDNPGLVEDCETLLSIRDGLGGGGGFLNWNPRVPMSGWRYVTLGGSPPRVVGLEVYSSSRIARVSPQLAALDGLEWLVIAGKSLFGPLPAELGSLSNLRRLTISNTSISGPIPPELGRLANLEVLQLDNNHLAGPVPPELTMLENLRELTLAEDGLSGCVPPELIAKEDQGLHLQLSQNVRNLPVC